MNNRTIVGYKPFTIEVLDKWKSEGFKTIETHLLEWRSSYEAIIELKPSKTSGNIWESSSINSNEVIEYAINDDPMFEYVVKE